MKKLFTTLLASFMVVALVGCSSAPAPSNETKEEETKEEETAEETTEEEAAPAEGGVQVGIVLPTKDEPRWLQDQASFETALNDAGFTSEVMFSQGNSQTELSNIEALIEKGVQVLVICPHDADAAAAGLEKAHDAGIKVISYDRIASGKGVDYVIGFDSLDVGVKQGQFLIDAYEGKKDVPLYLYAGAPTDKNAFIFFAGAWSVLNEAVKNGQFKVVNSKEVADYVGTVLDVNADYDKLGTIIGPITTNWDFNTAKSLAEGNLVAASAEDKGDVAILAPNDGTARAIADAFGADADVTSWVITGQDAEAESVAYIEEGKQSMTVWKDTRELAKATVEACASILGGGEPAVTSTINNGEVDIPAVELQVQVLTKDNLNLLNE